MKQDDCKENERGLRTVKPGRVLSGGFKSVFRGVTGFYEMHGAF